MHKLILVSLAVFIFHSSGEPANITWGNYPKCAQPILQKTIPPSCDHGSDSVEDTIATNNCTCPNIGWFTDIARDIFTSCGCTDLESSAQAANDNCAKFGNYPAALDVDEFISTGDGGEQICGVSNSGGWSHGEIAGVVVGVVFGVIMFVLAAVQILVSLGQINESFAPFRFIKEFFQSLNCYRT